MKKVIAITMGKKAAGGLVEFTCVPHHVHVEHLVALPGIDHTLVGNRLHCVSSAENSQLLDKSRSIYYLVQSSILRCLTRRKT